METTSKTKFKKNEKVYVKGTRTKAGDGIILGDSEKPNWYIVWFDYDKEKMSLPAECLERRC